MRFSITLSALALSSVTLATLPVPTGGPLLSHKPAIGAFTRLGCFTDSVHARVLNGAGGVLGDFSGQTLDKCAATCTTRGYSLFGVEYGGECWCDNTLASTSTKVGDEECNLLCPGDVNQYCGAGDRLELYQLTNLVSTTSSAIVPSTTSVAVSTTLSISTTSVVPLPTPAPGYFYLQSSQPGSYLQSSTYDFALSSASSAGQFAVYSGAYLSQRLPSGEIYYAQVTNSNPATNIFLSVRWQRYPGDNGIFSVNGGGQLEWYGSGVNRPSRASFWRCAGEVGLKINTRGFEEVPAGCVELFVSEDLFPCIWNND
jgi:hypothetical protein